MVLSTSVALDKLKEISAQVKVGHSKKAQVPAMLRTLSEIMHHPDARVKSVAVNVFSELCVQHRAEVLSSTYLSSFEAIRDTKSFFKHDQRSAEVLAGALSKLHPSQEAAEYMPDDYYMPPLQNSKIFGMIVRLVPNKPSARVHQLNAGVAQMRMVLVAGVISASVRLEDNDSAEEGADTSKIAKLFLSVKMAHDDPDREAFVAELSKAVLDGSENKFKLGSVDFWETKPGNNSGKDSPDDTIEKSTDFADSETADDGMYLDDDEKLASRATGKKRVSQKQVGGSRPWSMFNPSSALGLNTVYGSGVLEVVEYDAEEAEAQRAAAAAPKAGFGLFKRFFG